MFREHDDWLKDEHCKHDVPAGKDGKMVQYLPRQDYPKSQNHNMGDRKLQLKNSYAGNRMHSDVGWGQIRHSLNPNDMMLNTRPKNCNTMDKLTSLGNGN